ncbi:MAG TPA: SIMPL domain-containing protein [Candidatus Baltobacteraceae bacterium]|nr:SIMPL domain-containing protein [Candidatus Baltobacteraceae bacterium]
MQIRWSSRSGIAATAVALFGFCLTAQCQVVPGQTVVGGPVIPPSADTQRLTATGKASVDATPDLAHVRFIVECQNADATSSQGGLSDSVARVFQALETLGITREEIHPSAVTVVPTLAMPATKDHPASIAGFRTGETIEVNLEGNQLTDIGSVVETATKAGATRLAGISFDVNPASRQRTQLIAAATKEAQDRAQTMAATLGIQLGDVEDAHESGITITPAVSGVNGPLHMEASVTLHYHKSSVVSEADMDPP